MFPRPNDVIIDVSAAQGSIDLSAVAQSLEPLTLVGVIGRVTRGASVVDDKGIAALIDAMSMGLPFTMAYHFTTTDDGPSQAANLLRTIDHYLPALWGQGCAWVDIENDSVTNSPYDAAIGRSVLQNVRAYHPDQVGWYSDRSIGDALLAFDPIFTQLPNWLAIVDGDTNAQADAYGCTIVQYGQTVVAGTTGNATVDLNTVRDYATLSRICKVADPTKPKETDMIIFIDAGNAYLWGGGQLVSLANEPDVMAFLQSKGVFTCETAAGPQFAEFFARCAKSAPAPVLGPGTITGTLTF